MKIKILAISVFVLTILCFLLVINQFFSCDSVKSEEWFRESNNDYGYTVLGETLIEKNGFLASLGPHKIKVSVVNSLNQKVTLFTTEVKDDGGLGDYDIVWTKDGFELALSGSEQSSITYCFKWKQIFAD